MRYIIIKIKTRERQKQTSPLYISRKQEVKFSITFWTARNLIFVQPPLESFFWMWISYKIISFWKKWNYERSHCLVFNQPNLIKTLNFSKRLRPKKTLLNLPEFISTYPNLSNPIQTYTNLWKSIMNISNLIENYQNLSKLPKPILTYSRLFKCGQNLSKPILNPSKSIQTFQNLSETHQKLSKPIQTIPDLSKFIINISKRIQTYTVYDIYHIPRLSKPILKNWSLSKHIRIYLNVY